MAFDDVNWQKKIASNCLQYFVLQLQHADLIKMTKINVLLLSLSLSSSLPLMKHGATAMSKPGHKQESCSFDKCS